MTETSAFFNGVVEGDAVEAPYTSEFFADVLKSIYSTAGAVVLPGELNNLEVTVAAGRTVSINTGRAVIQGYWYENDAAYSLTLGVNTSAYGRYDRIVVEINTVTDTRSIKAIHGVPSSAPVVPSLPECSTLHYLSLARIYLPSSYVATSAYYLFDERIFANNAYHINTYNVQNTFPNGKFLVFGDSENTGVNRNPLPGGWTRYNTGSALKSLERFAEMSAGRKVNSYLGAANDGWSYTLLTSENFTDMFTLRLLVEVTAGECAILFNGITMRVPVSGGTQEIIIRGSMTSYQTLSIYHQTGSDNFSFSDIRFTHGFVVPEYATSGNYIIMFDTPIKMKRTGSPTLAPLPGAIGVINLSFHNYFGSDTDYEGMLVSFYDAKEVKALIVLLKINDSGSAAGAPFAVISNTIVADYMRVDLGGIVNDEPRYRLGIVTTDFDDGNNLNLYYEASGANAMDADLSVVGAIL